MDREIPRAHWEWARLHVKEIFDLEIELKAFYSNKNLAPWQGAATWVEGKQVVAVQLREALRKGTYLGIYRREEILAHEAVHAARAELESRKFEEFFAYMTSEKRWRRVMGPIVRSPWEVWPLIGLMGMGIVWEMGNALAAGWLIVGFARLIWGHWVLRKASAQIFQKVKDLKKTRAVLVRLTDEEIERWARGEEVMGNCPRWRAIRLAYFK